jgi:hypothetical protein
MGNRSIDHQLLCSLAQASNGFTHWSAQKFWGPNLSGMSPTLMTNGSYTSYTPFLETSNILPQSSAQMTHGEERPHGRRKFEK